MQELPQPPTIVKKFYNLKKWDRASHWDWLVVTFKQMDWAYAQWVTDDWLIQIGHALEYELKDDWIYYPVTK